MKVNQHTKIVGEKIVLVPYERFHVPRYHEWMKSEELQKLTASEPLTLGEEYDMQKSWREDNDKCTFIVLQKTTYSDLACSEKSEEEREIEAKKVVAQERFHCIPFVTEAMVGDVNLFFTEEDRHCAETEIMIAERRARGQGLGREALCSMLRYGVEVLGVTKYIAKIGLENFPSIRLFSQLGFYETSRSEIFKECTMEAPVTEDVLDLIKLHTAAYKVQTAENDIK